MKTTSSIIRYDLLEVWPDLRHKWVFDQEFWRGDLEELKELISVCRPRIEPYVQFRGQYGDCDDHSLFLVSEMRKVIIDWAMAGKLPPEQLFPRPIGRAMGSRFRGLDIRHSLCIAQVREGIYLFEGHEDRLWKADKENDSVFFVSI